MSNIVDLTKKTQQPSTPNIRNHIVTFSDGRTEIIEGYLCVTPAWFGLAIGEGDLIWVSPVNAVASIQAMTGQAH